MGLFDKLFKKNKSSSAIPDGELLGFLRYEATFRTQEANLPRFHEDTNPATLGSLLGIVVSKLIPHIESMSCIRTGELGKTLDVHHESDPTAILSTRLFPLVRKKNDDGEYIPLKGENVTFILNFNDNAPTKEAIVFLRGIPGQVTGYTYCMRVSLMIPVKREDDNLMTGAISLMGKARAECNSYPFQTSFIIYEDYNDTSGLLQEYENIEKTTLDKYRAQQELTNDSEWAIIRGIYEQHINAAYIAWGRNAMESNRYRDAYNYFIRAFRNMATNVLRTPEKQLSIYYEVAHNIGICLERLERYDEAAYFLWVAHNNDNMGLNDLVRVYATLGDLTLPQQLKDDFFIKTREDARLKLQHDTSKDYSNKISLGYVLNELFGAKPGNLTSLIIIRKDDIESKIFISEEDEVWEYPMRDLLDDDTKVIVTYSPAHYSNNTISDKSGLNYESSFVMSIKTANEANGLMRINIMLPNFPYDDDKGYGNARNNTPEGFTFIMGKEVACYDNLGNDLDSILSLSYSLSDESRILEALHAARYAYTHVLSRWDIIEEDWRSFLAAAAFQIGFCLMDFKLHEKANYYLRSAASTKILEYVAEFINSFTNLNDLHVLNIIESYEKIEKEDYDTSEYDKFMKFLKRRKSFVYIEMKRYDDAEALLTGMLESNDKESKDFAINELEYLKNLRSKS